MRAGASAIDSTSSRPREHPGERWAWIALALLLLATAALRWRVLDAPLERDEGEYAYVGREILRGVPPYAEAYNMKLPGIYYAYAAVLAAFGETARGVHLGLLVANAASIVLVFLFGRRLFDVWVGAAAAAVFAVLSISAAVLGVFANGEHFLLPFALAGLLLVQEGLERDAPARLALGGILLGAAVVVKQHGFVFPLAAGVALVLHFAGERPVRGAVAARRAALLVGATLVPYLLTSLAMWIAGVFPEYWLWTVRYARAYVGRVSFTENASALGTVCGDLLSTAPVLCALAGLGLLTLRRWRFTVPFVLLSAASVFPGNLFRAHYFVMVLPALALLAALGAATVARASRTAAALLLLGGLAHSVFRQAGPLFREHPLELAWNALGSPFHLAPTIGERLKRETAPSDTIGILGSEPELCFYADRRSASGFLYTYALMEDQPFAPAMLEQFQREIESREPKLLVWVDLPWSWLPADEPYRKILGWFQRLRRDYDLVARYDAGVPRLSVLEGAEIERHPKPKYSIDLYRRRAR